MTLEDKQLLLRDLCARLPYCVIGSYSWKNREPHNRELTGCLFDELKSSWDSTGDSQFSPYLRPLSSMTDEEYKELKSISSYYGFAPYEFIYDWSPNYYVIDWLNAHHFDYRGLIEKGLAIAVTEENNPYK